MLPNFRRPGFQVRLLPEQTSRNPRRSESGPRERLRAGGPAGLADDELIALLLRSGQRGREVRALAAGLLRQDEGLASLAQASVAELVTTPGVGPAKAASIVAAFELGRRVAARQLQPGVAVRSPADVDRHFRERLRAARQEQFLLLLLDGRRRLIREVAVSVGTLTASLVHPRDVFRPALRDSAASVVLVHNHPSGDPTPSVEDRAMTLRLARAGSLLGIPVVDHIVVAETGFISLRENGDFPSGNSMGETDPNGDF